MQGQTAIEKWNQRYLDGHDDLQIPLPFLVDGILPLAPGRALDIACGLGRHSIWLSERGWDVTAIDGSEIAIRNVERTAPTVRTQIVDIEDAAFQFPAGGFDLIIDTFFLHRPLFPRIREALKRTGIAVFAFHLEGSFAIPLSEIDQLAADYQVIHKYVHKQSPTIELILQKP